MKMVIDYYHIGFNKISIFYIEIKNDKIIY